MTIVIHSHDMAKHRHSKYSSITQRSWWTYLHFVCKCQAQFTCSALVKPKVPSNYYRVMLFVVSLPTLAFFIC